MFDMLFFVFDLLVLTFTLFFWVAPFFALLLGPIFIIDRYRKKAFYAAYAKATDDEKKLYLAKIRIWDFSVLPQHRTSRLKDWFSSSGE